MADDTLASIVRGFLFISRDDQYLRRVRDYKYSGAAVCTSTYALVVLLPRDVKSERDMLVWWREFLFNMFF